MHYDTKVVVAHQKQVRDNFLTHLALRRFEELIRHSYAPIQSLKSIQKYSVSKKHTGMLGQGKKSIPPQHAYNSHLHICTCPVSLSIITCTVPMGKLRHRETWSLGRLIRTKSTYSLSVMHEPPDLLSTILIFCYQCLHFFSEKKISMKHLCRRTE